MVKKTIVLLVFGVVAMIVVVLLSSSKEEPVEEEHELNRFESGRADQSVPLPQEKRGTSELISDAVRTLIDPESGYQTRLQAMRKLGYELPDQEIDILRNFMETPLPDDLELGPASFNSIRNDAFEILLRQKQMPDGLGDMLVGVFNDSEHDPMWRNYCLQFMEPFYERAATQKLGLSTKGAEDAVSEEGGEKPLEQIRNNLWGALDERDNSNAATALLALDKLSRNHSEFDQEQIRAATMDLAKDGEASLANRVTALRLCGEQGNQEALVIARSLVHKEDAATMLRCAAIATLGELATSEEDLLLLKSCARSRNKRISQIATRALAVISAAQE